MKQNDIAFLIKHINDKMKAYADASLKESGLTLSQVRVMEFLHDKGGQATQKEIELAFKVSHPTIVGIVSRLEKKEFVRCFPDDNDHRNKMVCITDKARECAKKVFARRREADKRLLSPLSGEEVNELRRLLTVLYKNMI